jgi:hypothetical protein
MRLGSPSGLRQLFYNRDSISTVHTGERTLVTQLFASDFGKELVDRAEKILKSIDTPKASRLRGALRIVKANGSQFDEGAASNVEWIGKAIAAEVDALEKEPTSPEALDELYSTIYRFVREYELTLPGNVDLSLELRQLLSYPEEAPSEFSPRAERQFRFADLSMPVQIMKRLLGSELLMNIRNIQTFSSAIEQRIATWDEKLTEKEKSVNTLHDALKQYETAFNFVGLHKGFDDLTKEKSSELSWLRRAMVGIGVLALAPAAAELGYVLLHLDRLEQVKWGLLAGSIPVLTFTVLLIYYFRLAARAVDSTKSQLLQLELRKTLCRFIQSYIEYAKKAKDAGTESLSKFENVVFSGIVSTDEKMPATFDGMEQIASLVKALKT